MASKERTSVQTLADVFDLTRAEVETRKQVEIVMKFLKKDAPGFESSYLIDTGFQVGFRETRRIEGDYELKKEDILSTKQFKDNIAQCAYMIDIHTPTGTDLQFVPIEEGKSYGIPYRCLVPKGVDNLLVVGRCVSADHEANASIRVIPPCMAMGQAGGTAIAQSLGEGVLFRNINIKQLQEDLQSQGQVVHPFQ
jgi:hypothetical protein